MPHSPGLIFGLPCLYICILSAEPAVACNIPQVQLKPLYDAGGLRPAQLSGLALAVLFAWEMSLPIGQADCSKGPAISSSSRNGGADRSAASDAIAGKAMVLNQEHLAAGVLSLLSQDVDVSVGTHYACVYAGCEC